MGVRAAAPPPRRLERGAPARPPPLPELPGAWAAAPSRLPGALSPARRGVGVLACPAFCRQQARVSAVSPLPGRDPAPAVSGPRREMRPVTALRRAFTAGGPPSAGALPSPESPRLWAGKVLGSPMGFHLHQHRANVTSATSSARTTTPNQSAHSTHPRPHAIGPTSQAAVTCHVHHHPLRWHRCHPYPPLFTWPPAPRAPPHSLLGHCAVHAWQLPCLGAAFGAAWWREEAAFSVGDPHPSEVPLGRDGDGGARLTSGSMG